MKKRRFTDWQMAGILREADAVPVMAAIERHGISDQPIYLDPWASARSSI